MEGETEGKDNTENPFFNDLMSSMVTVVENKSFDNFFGAQHIVEIIKSFIVLPLKFPQLYKGSRAPFFNSFLLFGAPGCGKSHLLYATAKAAEVKLFVFHAWNLQSRLYGGEERAEQCIKTVFEVIRCSGPCIVCFEDLEVLSREEIYFKKGRTALLTELRSLPRIKEVIIMGMTLAPWKLDAELRRQFRLLPVPLPDQKARMQILHSLLNCSTHDLKNGDFEEVADRTHGFTGSDMHCLIQSAKMKTIKSVMEATHFKKVEVQVDAASQNDTVSTISVEAAVSNIRLGKADQSGNQLCPTSIQSSEQKVEFRNNAEKLMACKPEDEGAISVTLYDIPEDRIYLEHDTTMDVIRQTLQDTRPAASDEEISRFKQFETEFYGELCP